MLQTTFYTTSYDSPIGKITLASDGKALTGLWFVGQKYYADQLPPFHTQKDNLPLFAVVRLWLDIYFSGKAPDFVPPLSMKGTDFQLCVWKQLLSIPFGKTLTYGEIARKIAHERGMPSFSAQAVGGAVGRNPISLIIPCHRVIGAKGSLTGYAAGIEKKRWLLQMEQTGAEGCFTHNIQEAEGLFRQAESSIGKTI